MVSLPCGLTTSLYQNEAPRLVIVRQPKKRGYRFRYRSEGETHGGIPGEPDPHSGNKKFYPTVQLKGHHGAAKIVVTLVTSDDRHFLHAHSMIVNKELKKGFCIFDMPANSNILELKNIAIQHAVKDKLNETLMDRLLQDRFVRQFGWNSALKVGENILDISHYIDRLKDKDENSAQFLDRNTAKMIAGFELQQLENEAKTVAKTMAMNTCCLCFQAFLQDRNGKYTTVLDRVFSDVIIDGKTKEGAMLKIIRLSKVASSARGGEEVWLLADKLNADDVEVRFYTENKSTGRVEWEGFGDFTKQDVFKQAVLIFKTPRYEHHLDNPVKVNLQLRRKKDKTCASMPTQFTYKPDRYDQYQIGAKRKKTIPKNFTSSLQQQPKPDPSVTLNCMNVERFQMYFNDAGASSSAGGAEAPFMLFSNNIPPSLTISKTPISATNLQQSLSSNTNQQQQQTSLQFPALANHQRQQTPSVSSNPSIGESPSPVFHQDQSSLQSQPESNSTEPKLPMATNDLSTLPNDVSVDNLTDCFTDSFLGDTPDIMEDIKEEKMEPNFTDSQIPGLPPNMSFSSYLNNFNQELETIDPNSTSWNQNGSSNQSYDGSSSQGYDGSSSQGYDGSSNQG